MRNTGTGSCRRNRREATRATPDATRAANGHGARDTRLCMEVHDDDAAALAASLSGLGLKRKASAPTAKSCPACEELQSKRLRSRGSNLHGCASDVEMNASDLEMMGSKRRARARASTEPSSLRTALRRSPRWSTAATADVDMDAPQGRLRTALERPPVDAYDGGDEGEEEDEGTTLRRTRRDHSPKPARRWEYRSRYSE